MKDEILEPFAVPEVYADGVGALLVVGGMFKATFYSLQQVADGRPPARIAVMKLAMPASEVPDAACAAFQSVMRQKIVSLFKETPPVGC